MALPHVEWKKEMEKGARSPFLTWIFLPDGLMKRLDSLEITAWNQKCSTEAGGMG
jgi:hypothetical protein